MRNISPQSGLVKNAKVVILALHRRHIIVRLLGDGGPIGEAVPLSKRIFEFRENAHVGYTILRHQMPLRLAYVMTYNGCRSSTLDRVVLDVRLPCFTHGQLYTAISRVRRQEDIVIRRDIAEPIQAEQIGNVVI